MKTVRWMVGSFLVLVIVFLLWVIGYDAAHPTARPASAVPASSSLSAPPASLTPASPQSAAPLNRAEMIWNYTEVASALLPANWDVSTFSGQTGGTVTYSSPSGAQSATFTLATYFGANHDVVNGSDAFDPGAALPIGDTITGQQGNAYPFTSADGFTHGVVFTAPNWMGAVTLTIQSGHASVWQTAVRSARMNPAFNMGG